MKKKNKSTQKEKDNLIMLTVVIGVVLILGVISQNLLADQITHKFKSPSFNGINTSSHYLTIENQEFNRKQTIKDEHQKKSQRLLINIHRKFRIP